MKLEAYQTLHCDAGWRRFSFLKLTAENVTTGISEYNECYGSQGLTGVIEGMLEWAVGKNPMAHEKLTAELYARSRQVHGGMFIKLSCKMWENTHKNTHIIPFPKTLKSAIPCYYRWRGKNLPLTCAGSSPALGT